MRAAFLLGGLAACTFPRPEDVPFGESAITIRAGNGQEGIVARRLPDELQVNVTDADFQPIPNFTVEFTVLEGDGELSESRVRTDVQGNAFTALTFGTTPGTLSIGATGEGVSGEPVRFTATSVADAFAQVSAIAGDGATTVVGSQVATTLIARSEDQFGNPVPGVELAFAVVDGAGTLTTTTAVTGDDATAETALTVGTVSGPTTVEARAQGSDPAVFVVDAAADVAVSFSNAASAELAGPPLVPLAPFEVIARDRFGNPAAGAAIDFVRISGTGGLSAQTATTDDAGHASVRITPTQFATTTVVEARGTGLVGGPVRFTGRGTGFRTPVDVDLNLGIREIALVDLNRDNKLDIVIHANSELKVLINQTPTGALAPFFLPPTSLVACGFALAIADFDGDTDPDIFVPGCRLFLNTTTTGATTPSFVEATPSGASGINNPPAVADLDGDQRPDLVATNNGGQPRVFRNTTSPSAFSFAQTTVGNNTPLTTPAVADFDGDGRIDLALTNTSNIVELLRGQSSVGTITFAASQQIATLAGALRITVADLDSNGRPDLIAAGSSSLAIALNTTVAVGSPTFATPVTVNTSVSSRLVAADLNGDTKPDLVFLSSGEYAVALNGGAAFTRAATGVTGQDKFAVGDLNGDGRADLVVQSGTADTFRIVLAE